jgi:hypothetical protein
MIKFTEWLEATGLLEPPVQKKSTKHQCQNCGKEIEGPRPNCKSCSDSFNRQGLCADCGEEPRMMPYKTGPNCMRDKNGTSMKFGEPWRNTQVPIMSPSDWREPQPKRKIIDRKGEKDLQDKEFLRNLPFRYSL